MQETLPGLSLPRETFSKLTPAPFLQAHLQRPKPIRPNGRGLTEARDLTINTGSLTHCNGSAVVRSGDTAIVCGVRAELLLSSDVPNPPNDRTDDGDVIEQLGLLVSNVELSTGCSPQHLPGNPPSTLAQSLSYRILSLLHTSNILTADDLRILHLEQPTADDIIDATPRLVTKAYWTLYIDVLCIALDGNPFDTAWAAVVAALQDTKLPKARWEPDLEGVVCSPESIESQQLAMRCLPVAATTHVFLATPYTRSSGDGDQWMLADPDAFEEGISHGSLTVVTADADGLLIKIEKHGDFTPNNGFVDACVKIASSRRRWLEAAFDSARSSK